MYAYNNLYSSVITIIIRLFLVSRIAFADTATPVACASALRFFRAPSFVNVKIRAFSISRLKSKRMVTMLLCSTFFLICVMVGGVYSFALPCEGLYKLDIVHYNDFHARFEETSVSTSTCTTDDSQCLGGFPRLYQEIKLLSQEKPDCVILNAGDSFQGTLWYTLLKWNVTQKFMNMINHDAHALGNHEFDDGPEGVAPYIAALKAPVLAANMDTSEVPIMQGLYKGHTVIKRKGRKIGIIGLITQDTATLSSPGAVKFTDPGEATAREAKALTNCGVDIIILLSHCGLEMDKQLARDYGEYIDVIIGGHSHSLLWNGPSPSNETVAGPYPVFIENSHSHKQVLIVQASAFTKYMGNLTLYFDIRGDFVKWEGGPIFLNRSIPEDPEIKAKLQPYAVEVRRLQNVEVGQSKRILNYEDCVFGECALGDLIVDALNEHGKKNVESNNDYVAIIQRGDIKSSLEQNITKGQLFELLPYNDKILIFDLEGRYLLQALERSVSEEWALDPFKGPYVLQVSGIQVTYNVSKPEGERIVTATVNGKDIDSDTLYTVTTASYLAGGGDGFSMLDANKKNVQIVGRDEEVLEAYIKQNSPLDIQTEGRITITY